MERVQGKGQGTCCLLFSPRSAKSHWRRCWKQCLRVCRQHFPGLESLLTWVLSDKQALQYLNCQCVLNLSLCITADLCRMAKNRIGLELPPAGQGLSTLPGLYKQVLTLLCVPVCCINGMSVFKTVKPVPSLLNSFEEEGVNCQHKSRRIWVFQLEANFSQFYHTLLIIISKLPT